MSAHDWYVTAAYADINPYAFADPISPHLAAADAQATIEPWHIAEAFTRLQAQADFVVDGTANDPVHLA